MKISSTFQHAPVLPIFSFISYLPYAFLFLAIKKSRDFSQPVFIKISIPRRPFYNKSGFLLISFPIMVKVILAL